MADRKVHNSDLERIPTKKYALYALFFSNTDLVYR